MDLLLLLFLLNISKVFAQNASVQGRNSNLTFGNYVQHQNSLLSGTPLKKYNVQSVYDCLSACSSNVPCVSINANTTRDDKGLIECVLLDFDKYQNEGNFSSVKGIDHYTLPSKCEEKPCKYNGKCIPVFVTMETYQCKCVPGTTGKNCEIEDFNSCAQRYAAGQKDSGVFEIKAPDSTRLKVYCNYDNSTGWTMVLKSVSGVAQSPGSSELWASISLLETPSALSFLKGRAHYKNRLVEQWDAFKPNKIRLSIYSNSKEVVKVVFNGIGSNKNNWFAVDRVLSSPWTDLILSSVPKNVFSIPGDRPSYIRSFMMNSAFDGCENDNGWIAMVEKKGGCDWEKSLADFAMVYSRLSTRATYHVTAEDYARIIGYKNIIDLIRNAPTVATWDAGEGNDDDDDEKEEAEIPNGELVSVFKLHGDSDDELIPSSKCSTSPTHTSPVNGERSSLAQDSFSSKDSSFMMQRDLSNDIKELEEENEMLNQELSKLRIQHQKTIERLRIAEEELSGLKKNPVSSNVIHVNGLIENDDDMEIKDRRIEELQNQVSKLQAELINETKAKQTVEKEAESLSIQLASYQLQSDKDDISTDEQDDLDLPGFDGIDSSKTKPSNKEDFTENKSISDEIIKLKQENQRLTQQLKEHIRNELNHNELDEPTVSLIVYQQLKDSSEEEIFRLSEQIEEIKLEKEELEEKAQNNRHCQKCAETSSDSTSPDTSHKRYLESEVKRLKKKLKEKESSHHKTINLYRLHLISLIQGELDPAIEDGLHEIIGLRASEQFC